MNMVVTPWCCLLCLKDVILSEQETEGRFIKVLRFDIRTLLGECKCRRQKLGSLPFELVFKISHDLIARDSESNLKGRGRPKRINPSSSIYGMEPKGYFSRCAGVLFPATTQSKCCMGHSSLPEPSIRARHLLNFPRNER